MTVGSMAIGADKLIAKLGDAAQAGTVAAGYGGDDKGARAGGNESRGPASAKEASAQRLRDAFTGMFAAADAVPLPSKSGGAALESANVDLGAFDTTRLALMSDAKERGRLMAMLNEATGQRAVLGDAASDSAGIPNDLLDELEKIAQIGQGDMDAYAQIVSKVTDFFSKITDLMGELAKDVKGGTDSNNNQTMTIDKSKLEKYFQDHFGNITGGYDLHIKVDPADAAQWQNQLGDEFSVDADGNIKIKAEKAQAMWQSINDVSGDALDMSAYQAWETAFSAQKDGIQNDVQTLAEKYSHQNSNFDNVMKVLSSSLQAILSQDAEFLKI